MTDDDTVSLRAGVGPEKQASGRQQGRRSCPIASRSLPHIIAAGKPLPQKTDFPAYKVTPGVLAR
jgi:hypothetical protein